MTDAFVLGGVRTPVGRYGGSLSHVRTDDLLGRPGVFAVGDVRSGSIKRVASAVGEGAMAVRLVQERLKNSL
jgi:acetyl-CoA acetyltransferase